MVHVEPARQRWPCHCRCPTDDWRRFWAVPEVSVPASANFQRSDGVAPVTEVQVAGGRRRLPLEMVSDPVLYHPTFKSLVSVRVEPAVNGSRGARCGRFDPPMSAKPVFRQLPPPVAAVINPGSRGGLLEAVVVRVRTSPADGHRASSPGF